MEEKTAKKKEKKRTKKKRLILSFLILVENCLLKTKNILAMITSFKPLGVSTNNDHWCDRVTGNSTDR